MTLWDEAVAFALHAHAGQRRKYTNDPYVNHCVAVAREVERRGGTPAQCAAALLHDTIEDTSVTAGVLAEKFRNEVAALVFEVTDRYTKAAFPEMNRAKRKQLEAERLGTISEGAKLIKLCDLIDNTASIVRYDPDFAVVYLREKADTLEAMGYGKGYE